MIIYNIDRSYVVFVCSLVALFYSKGSEDIYNTMQHKYHTMNL